MRFWEAMKALEEGKKVRVKDWDEDHFIHLDATQFMINNLGVAAAIPPTSINKNWELFEEPQEPEKLYLWIFKGSDSNWHVDNRLRSKEKYGKHIPTAQVLDGPWIEKDGKLVRVEE